MEEELFRDVGTSVQENLESLMNEIMEQRRLLQRVESQHNNTNINLLQGDVSRTIFDLNRSIIDLQQRLQMQRSNQMFTGTSQAQRRVFQSQQTNLDRFNMPFLSPNQTNAFGTLPGVMPVIIHHYVPSTPAPTPSVSRNLTNQHQFQSKVKLNTQSYNCTRHSSSTAPSRETWEGPVTGQDRI